MTGPKQDTYHHSLATMVLLGFLLICLAAFWLLINASDIEAWAAGTLGAILGYWANNFTQTVSYFFGSSQSSKDKDASMSRMQDASSANAAALLDKVPAPAAPKGPLAPAAPGEPVAVVPVAPQTVDVATEADLPQPGDPSKVYVLPYGRRLRWTGDAYGPAGE